MIRLLTAILLAVSVASGATLNVPGDHSTVQAAIDAAVAGDTILVGAGYWNENLETKRSGTSGSRITIDGQGVATLKRMWINHQYFTVQNATISGHNVSNSRLVYIRRGGSYAEVLNCVVDGQNTDNMYGIQWETPSSAPYTGAASNCLISDCEIRNIYSHVFLTVCGDDNIVEDVLMEDGNDGDFINLFGRRNIIRRVVCRDMAWGAGGNHPDMIQTWGTNGYGSKDNIIEDSVFANSLNCAIMQIEGDLIEDNGGWIIRRNIFMDLGGQASVSVKNYTFENNLFIRCNNPWSGFGGNDRETGGWVVSVSARYYETGVNVASGDIVPGYFGSPVRYRVQSTGGSGTITYNGTTYGHMPTYDFSFYGVDGVSTYSTSGDALLMEQVPNIGNGPTVKNNVFVDCGETNDANGNIDETGYYIIRTFLTGASADYNYVGKIIGGVPWSPVLANPSEIPVGGPGVWDNWKWYEPNGINGGNPMFVDFSDPDGPDNVWFTADDGLRPAEGSLLLGAGEGGANIGPYTEAGAPVDTGTINATTTNAGTVTIGQ